VLRARIVAFETTRFAAAAASSMSSLSELLLSETMAQLRCEVAIRLRSAQPLVPCVVSLLRVGVGNTLSSYGTLDTGHRCSSS